MNRLAQETSPYLLQHAHNPVDWFPWGEEAFEKARREEKPIFLSIGYASSHLCHVMERESFQDPEIAATLNEHFVAVKVDREERPDLDEIYMAATSTVSGQGGWPMNVFLTPDLKPFFAGTYFPPRLLEGRPGLLELLLQLSEVWREDRSSMVDQAERITARLARQFQGGDPILGLDPELLDQAVSDLAQRFDAEHGGFGPAPKFLAPASLMLLLRYYSRSHDPRVLEMVVKTLDAMAWGGIFDQLGGGFARYSVDERWMVPHFEKMLYDNAQIALVYLEAFQVTGSPLYREVAQRTLDFVLRDLTGPEGGFYCSLDSELDGQQGAYYCWSVAEILEVLGEEAGRNFCAYFGVIQQGNWQGSNVLYASRPLAQVAGQLGLDPEEFSDQLTQSRQKLLEARSLRPQLAVDDKVIVSWNGMMIQALAEGARILDQASYLEAAHKAADFLLARMFQSNGELLRIWRSGRAYLSGHLEDYAWLAEGLLSLYQAGGRSQDFHHACRLAQAMVETFSRPQGGFFDTAAQEAEHIVRPRITQDGALPAPQSVAGLVLAKLSYHLQRPDYRQQALATLSSLGVELRAYPAGFCRHLLILDHCLTAPLQICLSLPQRESSPLISALNRCYLPNRTVAWQVAGEPSVEPPLPALEGKQVGSEACIYLCQGQVCAAPILALEDLAPALDSLGDKLRFELYPRLSGRATPEATASLAELHPAAYRRLGRTNLLVSRLGFGGYRVDDETPLHQQALRQALEGGINLIDTSSNYTDGGSERLVGACLREVAERRGELVVVTKIGYVQGSNLEVARAREQMGRPYPDMVPYQEDCWHCLHPEYLGDQLERSQLRLGLATIDVLLLHNPEYFLLQAQQQGQPDVAGVRAEFERRLLEAFRYLEDQVVAGRIGYYGVSSNTLGGAEENLTTVSLERLLQLAVEAGGTDHHLAVLQTPLNLLETEAVGVVAQAEAASLGVLVNRPLNCYVQQTLVRLAEFEPESPDSDLDASLQALQGVEEEYRQKFGRFVQGAGSDQLFRFAENLGGIGQHLQNYDHWVQLESQRLRPALMEQVQALDQAMQGPLVDEWVEWRERYLEAFRAVANDIEEVALDKSRVLSESVVELLPDSDQLNQPARLSQMGCWVVDGIAGVSCVLVGMRRPEYVSDLLPVLGWSRCQDASARLKELESWSNPAGVMV